MFKKVIGVLGICGGIVVGVLFLQNLSHTKPEPEGLIAIGVAEFILIGGGIWLVRKKVSKQDKMKKGTEIGEPKNQHPRETEQDQKEVSPITKMLASAIMASIEAESKTEELTLAPGDVIVKLCASPFAASQAVGMGKLLKRGEDNIVSVAVALLMDPQTGQTHLSGEGTDGVSSNLKSELKEHGNKAFILYVPRNCLNHLKQEAEIWGHVKKVINAENESAEQEQHEQTIPVDNSTPRRKAKNSDANCEKCGRKLVLANPKESLQWQIRDDPRGDAVAFICKECHQLFCMSCTAKAKQNCPVCNGKMVQETKDGYIQIFLYSTEQDAREALQKISEKYPKVKVTVRIELRRSTNTQGYPYWIVLYCQRPSDVDDFSLTMGDSDHDKARKLLSYEDYNSGNDDDKRYEAIQKGSTLISTL